MFWKKIKSEEYKELYHAIEIIKIDIAMLQKRKLKKILPKETEGFESPPYDDGMNDLRKLNKEQNPQ